MPTICTFYGILIRMFYNHHARYGEFEATVGIEDFAILEGDLPRRALNLVQEWAKIHREELLEDWRLCRGNAQPRKIDPLVGVSRSALMYWDVVEVKAEAGHSLFVRFKDGLAGTVHLRKEQLTGMLAPLEDRRFFEQVFIDCGAVAWPGEIDLAPDAMYAEVAKQIRPRR